MLNSAFKVGINHHKTFMPGVVTECVIERDHIVFNKSDLVLRLFGVEKEFVIYVELEPIHAGGDFF